MIINRNKQEMQEELTRIKFHTDKLEARLANLPEEFDYPLYMQSSRGYIIKFTDLRTGEVIKQGEGTPDELGYIYSRWTRHQDRSVWTPVAFNKERGLYDKQLVWCSDNDNISLPRLSFYDADNNCAFFGNGIRFGYSWDNYAPAYVDEPWVKIAYDKLED